MAALLLIIQVVYSSAMNVSFETSPLHLPVPLYQHISATTGNSLHVLTGYTTISNATTTSYTAYSTSLFNASRFINHSESISFTIDPFNVPDFWQAPTLEPTAAPTIYNTLAYWPEPELNYNTGNCDFNPIDFSNYPIYCDQKCSQSIDNYVYIVQSISTIQSDSCIDLYLIIYNMDTQQYLSSSSYDYNHWDYQQQVSHINRYAYVIICVYSYSDNIVVAGSDTSRSMRYYYYDPATDTWSDGASRSFSILRSAGGCAIYNEYMYLFGGIMQSVSELITAAETRYGEKCSASPSSESCSYFSAKMVHYRSNFHITLIMDQYFLIYGGTTEAAQRSMELFDPIEDEFITEIEYDTASLNMYGFGALMMDNYLIITGGKYANDTFSDNIQYIDVTELFPQEEDATDEDIRLCVTTYITSGCVNIDDYLLSIMSEHIFDVHSDSFQLWIDPANQPEQLSLQFSYESFFDTLMLQTVIIPQGQTGSSAYQMDITDITENTAVDPDNDYFVFWLKYTPYLQWGFGDVFGEWEKTSLLISGSYFVADMTSFKVCSNARYGFYTNSCEMNMDLETDTFNVGTYIKIDWNLIQATSIKLPIYITSDDIIGVNHTMYITDNDYNVSVCTFCTGNSNTTCVACTTGIQVMDLIHYATNNNSYSVSIYSDYPDIVATKTFLLTRSVQTVHFVIEVPSDDDNMTSGLYPNAEIYITPIYDKTTVLQPFGTFQIQFDERLTIKDNVGEITIDFYEDICVLLYNGKSIDCYTEPIIVPLSMISASIDNLLYDIEITSSDTEITGDTLFSIARRVQTLSIEFSHNLYLGQVLDVYPLVSDTEIYQNISTISVSNAEHGIYAELNIEFDHNYNESVVIKQCMIETPLTGSREACDEGIALKIAKASALGEYIYLNLSSSDTYLEVDHAKVLITQCPLGMGLKGNAKSSWLCSDCEENTVNIFSNSECVSCDTQFAKGAKCDGSNELIVTYNYWLGFNDADSSSIIATFCPSGYCCQNIDGCDYLQNLNRSNAASELCAANRDPTVPLCGACLAGYTEVFGSATCKKCEENRYSYLIIPFISSILFVLLLLFLDQPPSDKVNQNAKEDIVQITPLVMDDLKSLKLCLLRPLLYYYQAVNYVTVQTGLWFYLAPLARVFSLDLFDSSETSQEAGICFVNNMKSMDKQLWYLFVPISMFIAVGIFAVVNVCIKYKFKKQIRFLNFGWNVVWTIFILLIGNIVSTMLKILACSKVNDEFKHFYDGSQACFGALWIVALIFVSLIIVIWIVVWLLLYRMDANKRDSRKSYLRSVTKSYKVEYWFWEILLVSRRILLAFMVTIQYVSYDITQYILAILLTAYLCLHYRYYPFNSDRANVIESLCLFLLIITLMTVIFEFHVKYPAFVSIMMSIMVSLPMLWLLAYALLLIKQLAIYNMYRVKAKKSGIESLSQLNKTKYEARKEKWAKRLTQSQRQQFQTSVDGESEIKESDDDGYKQMEEGQDTKVEIISTDKEDKADVELAPIEEVVVVAESSEKKEATKAGSDESGPKKAGAKKAGPKKTGSTKAGAKKASTKKAGSKKAGAKAKSPKAVSKKTGAKKAGDKAKSPKTKGKKKALPGDTKGDKKKGSTPLVDDSGAEDKSDKRTHLVDDEKNRRNGAKSTK